MEKAQRWYLRFTLRFYFVFIFFLFCSFLYDARVWAMTESMGNRLACSVPLSAFVSLSLAFATFQISPCSCFSCYQRSLKLVGACASDRTKIKWHVAPASKSVRSHIWDLLLDRDFRNCHPNGVLLCWATGFSSSSLHNLRAVCHSRDFYYTTSAYIIKSIKILCSLLLFFTSLLSFFSSLTCSMLIRVIPPVCCVQ